jgi:hypothetical protein
MGGYPSVPIAIIVNFARFSHLAELDMGHSIHQTLLGRSLEELYLDHFFCLDCRIVCRMDCCKIVKIVAFGCLMKMEQTANFKSWHAHLSINLIPQLAGTFKSCNFPWCKHQSPTGGRIPASAFILFLYTEFAESRHQNIFTGCQCAFNDFEQGFYNF